MKKIILPICIIPLVISSGCQNTNVSPTEVKQGTTTKTDSILNKVENVINKADNLLTSTLSALIPLEFDQLPEQAVKKDESAQTKIEAYLKKNDIFSAVPYNYPEKYKTDFSGDGTPVFDLRKDFSGDGTPVFGIKNKPSKNLSVKANEISASTYLWDRKPGETLLDYLQLNNIVERRWGITNYATYSQLIEYNINVSGAINNNKTVRLVKQVSFGLTNDQNNDYKLYSISPLSISRIEPKSLAYQIRSITFSSNKNKVIVYGSGKLIPLPGISISKHVGSNKFKVFVEVVFSKLERPKEFAVVLGMQGKQYQMSNVMGNIYGADIEAENIESTTGLAVELIDRDSLEKNDDYQGSTWILPIAN